MPELSIKAETIEKFILTYGVKILGALVILIIGRFIAKLISRAIRTVLLKSKVDETLIVFISNIVYAGALAFVIVAAISNVGINTTSLAAVIGAASITIGLAFQSSLSNITAGVILIILRPFKVGQFIEVGGVSGTVEKIDILITELKTLDNKKVTIPNNQILSDKVINYSAHKTRRIDLVVGIGYDCDLKKAKELLESILKSDSKILATPEPFIGVIELAATKVNLGIRPWVKTSDYLVVQSSLLEKIKISFHENGIIIPHPELMR